MPSFDLNPHASSDSEPHSATNISMILLHGGALSHRTYRAVIPFLTPCFKGVYAPDLLGHGSAVPLGAFTFSKSTAFLLSVIKQLKATTKTRICLVGVSLGGQVVLDVLQHDIMGLFDCAIVASAPVQPPGEIAKFEIPQIPQEKEWLDLIMEDVAKIPPEYLPQIQDESFGFKLEGRQELPPVLVMVGDSDIAMAKRDFRDLCEMTKALNERSEGIVLRDAWHNHPIDIPERFAILIKDWAEKMVA